MVMKFAIRRISVEPIIQTLNLKSQTVLLDPTLRSMNSSAEVF